MIPLLSLPRPLLSSRLMNEPPVAKEIRMTNCQILPHPTLLKVSLPCHTPHPPHPSPTLTFTQPSCPFIPPRRCINAPRNDQHNRFAWSAGTPFKATPAPTAAPLITVIFFGTTAPCPALCPSPHTRPTTRPRSVPSVQVH